MGYIKITTKQTRTTTKYNRTKLKITKTKTHKGQRRYFKQAGQERKQNEALQEEGKKRNRYNK